MDGITLSSSPSSEITSKSYKLSKFYKWCPHDDFLLVKAAERGLSAEDIRATIKFERAFTTEEITERWLGILYDPVIAQTTARHLMILQNTKNHKRVPWSSEENQIIFKEVESHQDVTLNFELIYDKYRDCLHPSRCPKTLEAHYQRMRRKGLLKGLLSTTSQTQAPSADKALEDDMEDDDYDETKTFSDVEKEVLNAPISNDLEMRMQSLYTPESKVSEKSQLKKIHKLEKESEIDEQAKGPKKIKLTEDNVLAVLDGLQSKLNVLKAVSTIGRKNSGFDVDIDLTLESEEGVRKISRKQAVLTLTYNIEERPLMKTIVATGETDDKYNRIADVEEVTRNVNGNTSVVFNFILKNVGKRPILVNGEKVEADCEMAVPHQSLIQFPGGLKFVFKWNHTGLQNWMLEHK